MQSVYQVHIHYLPHIAQFISNDNEQFEAIDPLYDTIPYSDPTEVRAKGDLTAQAYEKEWAHKRPHIYDKIYEDIQQPSSSIQKDTAADSNSKSVMKNVPKDEIQVLEDNDK